MQKLLRRSSRKRHQTIDHKPVQRVWNGPTRRVNLQRMKREREKEKETDRLASWCTTIHKINTASLYEIGCVEEILREWSSGSQSISRSGQNRWKKEKEMHAICVPAYWVSPRVQLALRYNKIYLSYMSDYLLVLAHADDHREQH